MRLNLNPNIANACSKTPGKDSENPEDIIIALAGNPNTGKSTVFNGLTGLRQHTGNWPGKTVSNARGKFTHKGQKYTLVDLPGTYSLFANSPDEEIARDFICFAKPRVTIIVADATCLERNLNLILQITEISDKIILCVNLMDEAKRKKIKLKLDKLADLLGIPVIGTTARKGKGLRELKDLISRVAAEEIKPAPKEVYYGEAMEKALKIISEQLNPLLNNELKCKWAALRLLEGDDSLINSINEHLKINLLKNKALENTLNEARQMLKSSGSRFEDFRDIIVFQIFKAAEEISRLAVEKENPRYNEADRKLDKILTSRLTGIPIMLALLGLIFWLTIQGANLPSALLAKAFWGLEGQLSLLFARLNSPPWLHDMLVLGVFRTLAWVISVMLPPMAIFFPLFTLLEDLGYLPRIAFNLDHFFKKACAHGKQALTMCMGFGCNAAGIIACRIIDSPRERLIAIITNNFVPCNGRFPTLIALAGLIIPVKAGLVYSLSAALTVLAAIISGIIITLIISRLLSKTILKGLPSSFTLELPPYRKPQLGRIIIHSFLDRTLFVLGRAIMVAAPAGLLIWLMANTQLNNASLLSHCAQFLNPFGRLLGLDGYILMAFILGLPANEIVLPILIMSYMAKGAMVEITSLTAMRQLFLDNGWTWLTAVSMMLFSLNHWPCGTTLLTIKKETQSLKWTLISLLVPTLTGVIVCFITAQGFRLLSLI